MSGAKASQASRKADLGYQPDMTPLAFVKQKLTGSLGNRDKSHSLTSALDSRGTNLMQKIITMLFGLVIFRQVSKSQQEVESTVESQASYTGNNVAQYKFPEADKLKTSSESEEIVVKKLQCELQKKIFRISELKIKLQQAMKSSSSDIQQMQKQLTLERMVVRDLAQRLEILRQEKDKIKEDYYGLKHGHAKSVYILEEFLNDFVALSLQIPLKSQFVAALEKFKEKIKYMAEEIKTPLECATFIVLNKENEYDLVVEYSDEDDDIDISAISDADAKDALIRFIIRKKKYSKACNKKIIGNLRRVREMSLKLKSTEESLKQVLAEKELQKTQFLQENAQLRKILKEYDEVWGTSCSMTVESLRAFVKELEAVGQEIFVEKETLKEEVEKLSKENAVLRKIKEELGTEVARLEEEAFVEARKTVQEELEEIQKQNRELADENKRLSDRTSEEIATLRKKLETLQKDWKISTKENATLQRELRIAQEENARKKQQFSVPPHLQLQARHGTRRAPADEKLPVHSLPHDAGSASGGARAMSRSFSAFGRDLSFGQRPSANEAGPLSWASSSPSQSRQLMQCLKCSALFPVTNIEDYETHIRKCYNVTNKS